MRHHPECLQAEKENIVSRVFTQLGKSVFPIFVLFLEVFPLQCFRSSLLNSKKSSKTRRRQFSDFQDISVGILVKFSKNHSKYSRCFKKQKCL